VKTDPDIFVEVDQEVDEETVRRWLRRARLDDLNIFHDRNEMIEVLCTALLRTWGKDPYKEG